MEWRIKGIRQQATWLPEERMVEVEETVNVKISGKNVFSVERNRMMPVNWKND